MGIIEIGAGADENRLFMRGDILIRQVPKKPKDKRWKNTWRFMQSDYYQRLYDSGLVPLYTLLEESEDFLLFEVEQIQHLIRPAEYTSLQAAHSLATSCRINYILQGSGYLLNESHLHNFTFRHTEPILLDIGAIDDTKKMLAFTYECIERNIRSYLPEAEEIISNLQGPPPEIDWLELADRFAQFGTAADNEWDSYSRDSDDELDILQKWLDQMDFQTVIDIGGHNGSFSQQLLPNKQIVVVDNAEQPLTDAYCYARDNSLQSTHALIDITAPVQPEASHRLHLDANWQQRLQSDVAIMSSITHHLIRQGMSLIDIAEMVNNVATKYACIELIASTDPHVDWYGPEINSQALVEAMRGWQLVDERSGYEPGPSRDHRCWYLFHRL